MYTDGIFSCGKNQFSIRQRTRSAWKSVIDFRIFSTVLVMLCIIDDVQLHSAVIIFCILKKQCTFLYISGFERLDWLIWLSQFCSSRDNANVHWNAIREIIAILNQLMTRTLQHVGKMSSGYSLWVQSAHFVSESWFITYEIIVFFCHEEELEICIWGFVQFFLYWVKWKVCILV